MKLNFFKINTNKFSFSHLKGQLNFKFFIMPAAIMLFKVITHKKPKIRHLNFCWCPFLPKKIIIVYFFIDDQLTLFTLSISRTFLNKLFDAHFKNKTQLFYWVKTNLLNFLITKIQGWAFKRIWINSSLSRWKPGIENKIVLTLLSIMREFICSSFCVIFSYKFEKIKSPQILFFILNIYDFFFHLNHFSFIIFLKMSAWKQRNTPEREKRRFKFKKGTHQLLETKMLANENCSKYFVKVRCWYILIPKSFEAVLIFLETY